MPQKLDDLFSQEELDSMSDEEKAEFEAELASEVGDNDADTDADTDTDNHTESDTDADDSSGDEDTTGDDTDTDADTGTDADTDTEDKPDADKRKPSESEQRQQAQQEESAKTDDQEDQAGDQAAADPEAEKKEELQGKLKDLREQFEEGEITFEDYLDQRDEAKDQLREMATEARVREAIRQDKEAALKEQIETQWKRDQESFFSEEKTLDAKSKAFDEGLYKAFRQQAQIKLADPSYANVNGVDLLKEAAREARAIKGVQDPATGKGTDSAAQARQKANKSGNKAANTLADVPNDAEQDVTNKGKFDYIDRLIDKGKTIEAEKAIEKWSDEDKERYLRS